MAFIRHKTNDAASLVAAIVDHVLEELPEDGLEAGMTMDVVLRINPESPDMRATAQRALDACAEEPAFSRIDGAGLAVELVEAEPSDIPGSQYALRFFVKDQPIIH